MLKFFIQQILNFSLFALIFKLVAPILLAAVGGMFWAKSA